MFHSHTVCIQWSSAKIKVVSMFRNLDLAVSPPNVRTLRRPLRDHRLEHASHVPFKSIRESKRYGFPRPCPLFSDRRRRLLMSFPTPPLSLPSRARHLGSVSHCSSGEQGELQTLPEEWDEHTQRELVFSGSARELEGRKGRNVIDFRKELRERKKYTILFAKSTCAERPLGLFAQPYCVNRRFFVTVSEKDIRRWDKIGLKGKEKEHKNRKAAELVRWERERRGKQREGRYDDEKWSHFQHNPSARGIEKGF